MDLGLIFLVVVAIMLVSAIGFYLWIVWLEVKGTKQLLFIESYRFPVAIKHKIKKKYPHLVDKEISRVLEGLRTYFYICNQAGGKTVAMPSQAVDVAWHEFILFTKSYEQFSQQGFGQFLHHTPTEAMTSETSAQEGIKRAWRLSCAKEDISPSSPKKLPLLFGMDDEMKIKDGFIYHLNCKNQTRKDSSGSPYCAGHIACSSGCAGDFGGVTSCGSSCSSSCSSSCGGD